MSSEYQPEKSESLLQSPGQEIPEPPRETYRTRKSRLWTCFVVGLLAIVALGVGLGVGLSHRSASTSGSESTPLPTSPGNSSDISITVPRKSFIGDPTRYLLSNRNFAITSTPTTRIFNWTISEAWGAPGGMEKPMILINGQSPGPIVEANFGDRLIFNVFNNMTNETTVHWHGQYLVGENFMDGTYSMTQCGHTPGAWLTYNWTVQNVGTYWYHSHRGIQYTDGMYGALILHAPNETAYTRSPYYDDYTFILNDMYNTQGSALEWRFRALGTGLTGNPGDEPVGDGGMINGISQAKCAYIPSSKSAQPERRRRSLPSLRSTTGGAVYPETNLCGNLTVDYWNTTLEGNKTYRLRLINAGTFLDTQFSIDNHTLTVIEADGVTVDPIEVDAVDLAIGQRYSVLVTLNQTPGAYWIRNTIDVTQQARYYGPDFVGTTLGILRYSGVGADVMPNTTATDSSTLNTAALQPSDKLDAVRPDWSVWTTFGMQYTPNNQHYMFFNQSSWSPAPPGWSALQAIQNLSSTNFDASTVTSLRTSGGPLGDQLSIVNPQPGMAELVVNSLDDGEHPFHLHGHTFQILSVGSGYWSGDTSTLNMTNPMRRDTVVIPSYGHLVIRYPTTSAGVWVFHCHISWHMEIGLLLSVTNLPNQLAMFEIPQGMQDMCTVNAKLDF